MKMLISEFDRWLIREYYKEKIGKGIMWCWWNKPVVVSRYEMAKERSSLRKSMNETVEYRKVDLALYVFMIFIIGIELGYLLRL
jgi:hypothetical protein